MDGAVVLIAFGVPGVEEAGAIRLPGDAARPGVGDLLAERGRHRRRRRAAPSPRCRPRSSRRRRAGRRRRPRTSRRRSPRQRCRWPGRRGRAARRRDRRRSAGSVGPARRRRVVRARPTARRAPGPPWRPAAAAARRGTCHQARSGVSRIDCVWRFWSSTQACTSGESASSSQRYGSWTSTSWRTSTTSSRRVEARTDEDGRA